MNRKFYYAFFLAVAAGKSAVGADLSCSSADTKAAIQKIIAPHLLWGISAERAARVTLTGNLTAIRTVSETDTKHVCNGILEAHGTYTGRTKADVEAGVSEAYRAAQKGSNADRRAFYATPAGEAELKSVTQAEADIDAGIFDARGADYEAQKLNGDIAYTVEATDDGQAYVTILRNP